MQPPWFITGNDTGVGKTLLTVLLVRYLRQQEIPVLAVKPFCSGGRADAQHLAAALDSGVTLDRINPWHFRRPLSPSIAARLENTSVPRSEVLKFLRRSQSPGEILLIEGAGGLLSPLGPNYSARELILPLKAIPLVVCTNRLGVINQARLTWEALPADRRRLAHLILMDTPKKDPSVRWNSEVLAEFVNPTRIHRIPWLPLGTKTPLNPRLTRQLESILR